MSWRSQGKKGRDKKLGCEEAAAKAAGEEEEEEKK